jgi:sensor histidine kinase YesM
MMKLKDIFRVNRIAVLPLLLVLSAEWLIPAQAQDANTAEGTRQSQKTARNQQKAIEKYQRAQLKAQLKAQRSADKKQQQAMKKYDKEQRKLLKNASLPAKHTS